LDTHLTNHFADIIALAQTNFEDVESVIDTTPERAILRLQAQYGKYQVFVTELFSDGNRQYRYYVLDGDWVVAGFDNSPDPRAIRLKYRRIGKEHTGEAVPHLHQQDKTQLSLTEPMAFVDFIAWLHVNLPKE